MWFLFGMGVAVLSTFLTTVSLFIQKRSADIEKGRPPWRRYRFIFGVLLNISSEMILFSFAMTLTPISLLAPLTGMGVVFSALIASSGVVPGVKEKLHTVDWICTCLVLLGVSVAAIFGPGSHEASSLDGVAAAFANPGFLSFVIIALTLIMSWLLVLKVPRLRAFRPQDVSLATTVFSGVTSALCGALCVMLLKVIMVAIQLLTKDSDSSSDDPSPFRSWAVWVSAGGLLLLAPLQLYLLNAMLASGSVTLSVPLYLSLMVLLVGVGGGLLCSEFDAMPAFNLAMFALSVALVMSGLAVLSYRQQLKILHQQQLEAQQQLHAGAAHSGVSKSSSGKSSSHRDERSEAVRDEVDPNLEAIVVDGAVFSGRAQGSHAAEPMGRWSAERATTTRCIRVDLVPERQPGTARATGVGDSARQTRFEADIVAPSAAAVSLAATAAAPEAAPAASAVGAETESAGGHACSASAASVLAASDQGAQRGDAEDDDDPRLSL